MVALNKQSHHNGRAPRLRVTGDRLQGALSAQCSDHSSLAALGSTAAGTYSNGGLAGNIPNETTDTLIFTGPGTDGIWFTNDDVQSSYGANEIIYCGYRYDPETELYYVRNRSYNPILGRWLQRDPIGYAGGINLYEYVGGNPVVFTDPDGRATVRPSPTEGGTRRPTGNPSLDAGIYAELLKQSYDAAEKFLTEAAKRYAEDGDSASLAKALQQLSAGGAGAAADTALSLGLDALSKDLGAQLQNELGFLKGLSRPACVNMLEQIYQALEQAEKGNGAPCQGLNPSNNNVFSQCRDAIYGLGAPSGEWVTQFANKAQLACNRLAHKKCTRGPAK